MTNYDLPDTSDAVIFDDLDRDGYVGATRRRDYVQLRNTGGSAGPTGCPVNLSADDAARLGETLIQLAAQARTYGDRYSVHGAS